jgi:uncharacterized protein with von Willebrand factor type A (vWA) domain
MTPDGGDLVARTVSLCRALRERGLLVTTSHATDAVRALRTVGLHSRANAYWALRCVLAARPEDFGAFDELFERTFGAGAKEASSDPTPFPRSARSQRTDAFAGRPQLSLAGWLRQDERSDASDDEPEEIPAASEHASLTRKDFSAFADDELAQIERVAERLARKLAARPSRRWMAAPRGTRVDLRRTIRRSLSNATEPLELRFRRRRPRKTRIVALCDVSGSMDLYSRFLLQFLYALQGSLARVESFVFSTSLRRVTEALRQRPWAAALRELSGHQHDWSGGTRIGACLAIFNAQWSRLVDRRTVVVILSDGWDTGEPPQLAAELESLKMRSRRLIWLNPLLGSPGYQPLTQGMQAALPHVSVFAPAHNLASLAALERYLLL